MRNALSTADLAMESMIEIVNDLDFTPSLETADAILTRRTLATRATCQVAESAVEAVGGSAYFRKDGLERRLRDVRAGQFHPLPPKKQVIFSGRVALGLDPIG